MTQIASLLDVEVQQLSLMLNIWCMTGYFVRWLSWFSEFLFFFATVRLVWPSSWPKPPPLRINLTTLIMVACSHWFLLGFVTALNNAWVALKRLLGENTEWGNILSFLRGDVFRRFVESVTPDAGVESCLHTFGFLVSHVLFRTTEI
jgi:hypothetical protein